MNPGGPSTYQKARRINLDSAIHGTLAEIGGGQEVARWFFQVGGAASTVAKTISAYDMAVSDAIYGPSDRYVSRQRLGAMLDHEYALLLERLGQTRGATTRFFAFADTVATRSYARPEEGHGWLGVRFQPRPETPPSDILIHARMLDTENVREQEALGILGINLLHGATYHHEDPVALIRSLMDDLTRERVEIDMVRFSGPVFAGIDNRLMSLQLVEQTFTSAAMFAPDGEVVLPAEILHKRPVVIERGSFRPVTHLTLDILERCVAQFGATLSAQEGPPIAIMEMSLRDLLMEGRIDHADFLARVDILGALGKTVMVSNYTTHFQVAEYLHRSTSQPIAFALGVPNLRKLFDESYYTDLAGGILEAFGRLFKARVRLFVYPAEGHGPSQLVTVATLGVDPHLRHLYAHLVENGLIRPIQDVDEQRLHIHPREVLARIQAGDPTWEAMVPAAAVRLIKDRRLFRSAPDNAPAGTTQG